MRALVIGGARSGFGAALLLHKMDYDVTLVSRDDFSGRLELESKGITVVLDDKDTNAYDTFDIVVKNPGIPNSHPLVKRFKTIYNEIDIAAQYNTNAKFYAISGTNGKTTTTTLLHLMLEKLDKNALLAGNIGISLSEKVYESGNVERPVALEISAFQMENSPNFKPEIYALLNLTPDHLDRFESEEAYYQAKLTILDRVSCFVRNADDDNIMSRTKDYKSEIIDISLKHKKDVYLEDGSIIYNNVILFKEKDIKIPGKHNLMNAMFASVIAYRAGVAPQDIQDVISNFKGVEHRIEFVRELNGVRYYNDSKATNPESTATALESFDKNIILLAGGFDKKISFDILSQYEPKLKKVFVFGESKDLIKHVFKDAIEVKDLNEAVIESQKYVSKGDTVLLSPACASYDQFSDFEERGDLFKELVNNL